MLHAERGSFDLIVSIADHIKTPKSQTKLRWFQDFFQLIYEENIEINYGFHMTQGTSKYLENSRLS